MNRTLLPVALMFAVALPAPIVRASPFGVPVIPVIVPVIAAQPESADGGDSDDGFDENDPTIIAAKAEYRAGGDAYALGKYGEAVLHFERAYELSQEPALLFNLGQSYTRWYDISNDVEHLKKARRLYENYVLNIGATELDEQGQAEASADAQTRIADLDKLIAKHQDTTNGPAVDDKSDKPAHKKAWFWVAIIGGAAVIGGVAAAVVVTTRPKGFDPELGTIGTSAREGGGLTLRF